MNRITTPAMGYNLNYGYPTEVGMGGLGGFAYQRGSDDHLAYALIQHIIKKIDSGFDRGGMTLAQLFGHAHALLSLADKKSLPPDQQAKWEEFKSWALRGSSWGVGENPRVWWSWVWLVRNYGKKLSNASWEAQSEGNQWLTDPEQAANVLTVATGGGLTEKQWYNLGTQVFQWAAEQTSKGLLNLNYLSVCVQCLLHSDIGARKFPVWLPPTAVGENDPVSKAAWKNYLNKSGWSQLVKRWGSMTSRTWVQRTSEMESYVSLLSRVRTTLSYASGAVVIDKVNDMLGKYGEKRNKTIDTINKFNALLLNPKAKSLIPVNIIASMKEAERSFIDIDNKAYEKLNPVGLWQHTEKHGITALDGLGWLQIAIGGGVAIVIMGIMAYLITSLTKTYDTASDNYRKASELVWEAVEQAKKNCKRQYEEGALNDEEYQACLQQSLELADKIPEEPDNPLGSMNTTLLLTAGAGLTALYLVSKAQSG